VLGIGVAALVRRREIRRKCLEPPLRLATMETTMCRRLTRRRLPGVPLMLAIVASCGPLACSAYPTALVRAPSVLDPFLDLFGRTRRTNRRTRRTTLCVP
jgi:hypothetical protein